MRVISDILDTRYVNIYFPIHNHTYMTGVVTVIRDSITSKILSYYAHTAYRLNVRIDFNDLRQTVSHKNHKELKEAYSILSKAIKDGKQTNI